MGGSTVTNSRIPDFVLSSPDGQYRFEMCVGDVASVGREASSEFRIPDPAVSRRHATLMAEPNGIRVTDEGSTAGTRINGHNLSGPGQAKNDELIEIGPVRLRVADTRQPATIANSETSGQPAVGPAPVPNATSAWAGWPPAGAAAHPTTTPAPYPAAPPPATPTDSGTAKPPKTRVGQLIAIVVAGATVLSAVVGLLVYLQARPSTVARFEESVDRWCTAYRASYPQPGNALDLNTGQWDPVRIREFGQAVASHDNRFLGTFRDLNPPAELRDSYDAVDGSLAAVLAEDRKWAERLQQMSDREIRKTSFPTVPGYRSQQDALGRELLAHLTELSGGKCTA
jgi:hypothetical protein